MTVLEKQFYSRETIELQNNQTGKTYEELFCDHFNGATEIKILEPYIRQAYQFSNLKMFVQLLFETQGIARILLITTESDGRKNDYSFQDQIRGLESLKEYFEGIGVEFKYEFDNHLHVRRISCDKGRTINSDRGLHIFKQPRNALESSNQSERLSMQTEIEYLEPIDVSSIIASLQDVSVEQKVTEEDYSFSMITNTVVREASTYYQRGKTSITVDSITQSDVSKYKLRIVSDNKFLFAKEVRGKPSVYLLTFSYKDVQYDAKYTIGSRDNRPRSGVLKLGRELYKEIGIKAGTNLQIELEKDGSYKIL